MFPVSLLSQNEPINLYYSPSKFNYQKYQNFVLKQAPTENAYVALIRLIDKSITTQNFDEAIQILTENKGFFKDDKIQTSNITIYYTRLIANSDEEGATEQATYTLNFGPNRINFINNEFTTVITDGDDVNGDARLFLKGGEGSIAKFKLFNGTDLDDDDDTMNTFEAWKSDFVETDSEGNFVRAKRIVNEANLVFYVDQNLVDGDEPDRLYLYDVDNKQPLDDYFIDISNSGLPSLSKSTHLGPLQRVDDEPDGDGIKYKFTITEHINNLLLRDSTNVELGLAVSLNVNLEDLVTQRQVQTGDNSDFTVPVSSVISPRGTVLHGSNTEDSAKKVYLEIYYTEPNN